MKAKASTSLWILVVTGLLLVGISAAWWTGSGSHQKETREADSEPEGSRLGQIAAPASEPDPGAGQQQAASELLDDQASLQGHEEQNPGAFIKAEPAASESEESSSEGEGASVASTGEAELGPDLRGGDPGTEGYDAVVEAQQLFRPLEQALENARPLSPESYKGVLSEHKETSAEVFARAAQLVREGHPDAARKLLDEWNRLYLLYKDEAYPESALPRQGGFPANAEETEPGQNESLGSDGQP